MIRSKSFMLMGMSAILGIALAVSPAWSAKSESKIDSRGIKAEMNGKTVYMARYPKAFSGENNVSVIIAPYQKGEEKRALILFSGVESAWDGKILDHTLSPQTDTKRQDFVTKHEGKDFVSVVHRDYLWEACLPEDQRNNIRLSPNDALAKDSSTMQILRDYLAQNEAGEK